VSVSDATHDFSSQPAVVAADPTEPPPKRKKTMKGQTTTADAAVPKAPAKPLKCDRCDGPHESRECPHFKKGRDKHPDAQKGKGSHHMGASGGNAYLPQGKVVRQPGDGSCLFHSMSYGLRAHGVNANAGRLRKEIAQFVQTKPNYKISDTPVRDWVKWDAGCSVQTYCSRMSRGGWGGGIEMAACSRLKTVNVHVYERSRKGGYKRISCFDCPGSAKTVHVLYCGGVHYDALVPQSDLRKCTKAESESNTSMGMGMGTMGMVGFGVGSKKRKFGEQQHHQQQQKFGRKTRQNFGGGKKRGGWSKRW